MSRTPAPQAPRNTEASGAAPERVAFHPLVFQPEGDEVTVGRMDAGTFVVLPSDGAALLRRLVDGESRARAAEWYLVQYGEPVDIDDFVADLTELGFTRDADQAASAPVRVRWARLGRAVFSPVSGVLFAALIVAWLAVTVRAPVLLPTYHHLFFTHYMSLVIVTLYLAQTPLILLHEAAHALAGRRLGLPSRLSVGRRLYYLVFQTTMDGLVAVPRRKRYLPILAGMLTDAGVLAALTLVAAVLRRPDGTFPAVATIALALAYLTMLRLLWQCWFFLQTDVYYLVVTVLGCVDLQTTAKQLNRNRWNALRGRPAAHDPRGWHPRDRDAARWYSVLMAAGYAFSLATLAFAMIPAAYRLFGTVLGRLFDGRSAGAAELVDSGVFLLLSIGEIGIACALYVRDRRAARAAADDVAFPPS
ncbi:hypothetical protein ACPXCE_00900 [Streptomyces sp. DT24]|uniref:hypothetical protein n=1 Tax=unclassified Streptomyces TaxID=2593676 RepID=UPI003CFB3163